MTRSCFLKQGVHFVLICYFKSVRCSMVSIAINKFSEFIMPQPTVGEH